MRRGDIFSFDLAGCDGVWFQILSFPVDCAPFFSGSSLFLDFSSISTFVVGMYKLQPEQQMCGHTAKVKRAALEFFGQGLFTLNLSTASS